MNYRREIDGLRAISVLVVILYHAGVSAFSGGFVGVDVFFVISGYLITSIIVRELDQGKFSLKRFYERRARRILPALFVVMASTLPFAWFWMLPEQRLDYSTSLAGVATFSSNILFWLTSGYFSQAVEEIPLLHTWSLAVEEQFYFFFPLLLLAVWRIGWKRVGGLVAGIALLSLLLSELAWRTNPSANFFLAPTRAWELLAGSLCAFWQFKREAQKSEVAAAAGLLLIILAVFLFDSSTPFPSLYAILPVGGAALILLFGPAGTHTATVLSARPLVGVGLISYSAYLWHQPIFAFARIRSQQHPSVLIMLGLSVASLMLAYLSWRFVEQPCRRQKATDSLKGLRLGALGSLCFLAIGLVGVNNDGFGPESLNARQQRLLSTVLQDSKALLCLTKGEQYTKPKDACAYYGEDIRWAVIGDSHAVELAGALARRLQPKEIGVRQLSFANCPPSFGRSNQECGKWTEEATQYLVDDAKTEVVVVAYRLNYALFGPHHGVYPDLPRSVAEPERLARWQALLQMLQQLRSANKTVLLLLQVPELPTHITKIILESPKATDPLLGVPTEWWHRRAAFVQSRRSELPSGVVVYDPSQLFCDEVQCYAGRGDTSYYYDDDHASEAGADMIAAELPKLLSAGSH